MLNGEKIKIAVIGALGFLGFFTGLQYQLIIGNETLKVATGCFEFGLLNLLGGDGLFEILAFGLLDTLVNSGIFLVGCLGWWAFPATVFNQFGLNFKMGVCVSFLSTTLGFSGIVSIIVVAVIAFCCLIGSTLITYGVLNRAIYHTRYKKTDITDKNFIINVFKGVLIFILINAVLLTVAYFTNLGLKGFFNTVL